MRIIVASYKLPHIVVGLTLLHLVLRVMLAMQTELTPDESYYTIYAGYLDWSYYDHPPLVGYLIALTTAKLHLTTEIFVRFCRQSLLVS